MTFDDAALKAKIDTTTTGSYGLGQAFQNLAKELSPEQLEALCDNTRNGEDFWTDKQSFHEIPGNEHLGFMGYVRHVLSTTSHPLA